MKTSGIKKINTAGKIGKIVCILLIICSIAAMVAIGICGVMAGTIAKDEVRVKVATSTEITATDNILNKVNKFVKLSGVNDLNELITENGNTIKIDDKDVSEISATRDGKGIVVNAKTNDIVFSIKRVIAALVIAFLYLGSITVALYMLKALMVSLSKCETPFNDDIIKKMMRFVYSLIPVIVLKMFFSGIWSSFSTGSDFSLSINLGSILLVCVIYLLVVIFRYGAELQQESDETL